MKRINIAIDGLSGSGKSTVAKIIAKRLGYTYIDTGSMYRCVAYLVLKNNVDPNNKDAVMELLQDNYDYQVQGDRFFLNDEDVTLIIRSSEVNKMLTNIVHLPHVRKFLVEKQQEMGKKKGVIMDGRDIASVVLKDAELKIFQVADLDVRAYRRHKENLEKGIPSDLEEVKENLAKRDYVDTYVSKALVKVDSAIEVDTTNMSIEQVCNHIIGLAEKKVR